MNKLIIDAVNKDIFLMIIMNNNIYNISHENSKTNYEKIVSLINDFLSLSNLKIENISKVYVNQGPGSFAGIRNSLAVVKAINLGRKIDYYCFSFADFKDSKASEYVDVPRLCECAAIM